jgi:protein TonB
MSILINFVFAVLPFTSLDTVPPPIVIAKEQPTQIFEVVEQMPRFPGCEDIKGDNNDKLQCANQKMLTYISSQVKYPNEARNDGIQGTVVVSFIVDENGNLTNLEFVKKIGGGCDEETMRVFEEMAKLPQKWTAGKQDGKNVKVRMRLPLRFTLKT